MDYIILIFKIVFIAASVCYYVGNCCDKNALQRCLDPLKAALAENTAQNSSGLLQKSIEHYYLTLEDEHSQFIHISSLNTIMQNLDDVFVQPSQLTSICSVVIQSEQCLKNKKVFCDEEIRDELEGLENMFNFMCSNTSQKEYKKFFQCLTKNELNNVRNSFDEGLEKKLNGIAQPFAHENNSDVTGVGEKNPETLRYDLHQGGIYIKNGDKQRLTPVNQAITRQVCGVVRTALQGYKTEVQNQCSTDAAEWDYNLRHGLVQILLIDLGCEEEDEYIQFATLLNETNCFPCNNGKQCIDRSRECDGEQDCLDGSDEEQCGSSFGTKIFSVVIGLAVTTVVIIIIIVCVVKCREETAFGNILKKADSSSTEMMSITQQELSLGNSTPPVSASGQSFVYKPVPNNNNYNSATNA